jgi:uncharacterized phage protein (TIGR01671 family)
VREIKFRAWDKVDEVIREVLKIDFDLKVVWLLKYVNGEKRAYELEFDDIELIQFTGLHDKNGKEIYEGNVLIIYQMDVNGKKIAEAKNVVHWNNAEAKFDFEWSTNGLVGIGGSDFDLFLYHFRKPAKKESAMDWYFTIKVIGDIYENPELLKEDK